MPITIKSTELKYKNPSTGQYQGVDAVAEMTTSEQCALIEAKGAEVIESIPSDYTALSTKVGSSTLDTTAQNLSDAINEHESDVSALNGAITSVENSIAILSNNNTHAAIAEGQYVYIRNHGTLAEGLYQATAAIPQNDALSSSNVTAVSGGGLNAFVGKKLTPILETLYAPTNPVLMEAGTNYPLVSGKQSTWCVGFIFIYYPSNTVVTANKITLDELYGIANSSHYSLATTPTGQIRVRHSLAPTEYQFTDSESTIYLHRIYGLRYEIN